MLPSASSSSSVDWAEWVPECLQPAIAIASELPYHHDHEEDEDEDDEDDGHAVDNEQDPHQNSHEEEEDEVGYHRIQEHTQFHRVHHHLHRQGAGAALRSRGRQQHQHHLQNHRGDGIVCVSCKELYCPLRGGGTCYECYEEASEAEAALKKEIEELNARIVFLRTWAPEAMSEQFSDLVLESSDGSKIRAHRAILVSRSPVFKAMLESEMEESRSGIIKITDFSYEILRLFVHYLYTAEIYPESLEECAFDLLALAEKYNVKHLKAVCERFMTSKVNCDNALFSFEYACQHGAKTLKEAALSAILDNIEELPHKIEYHELVDRDAKLVVEIFEAYLAKKCSVKQSRA
ncbi:hypothetical protein GOP47_0001441 [Adiantum capillus-veneris]|uniref:BTB domain-containing protein n=1 Tax=Adiantum capillus-veneris TaxID=13818 RepID=A0A9D4ZN25_ADICA|nr:hypothetical protein GOP47_0001441 [Adiantum capillus-veneris]